MAILVRPFPSSKASGNVWSPLRIDGSSDVLAIDSMQGRCTGPLAGLKADILPSVPGSNVKSQGVYRPDVWPGAGTA